MSKNVEQLKKKADAPKVTNRHADGPVALSAEDAATVKSAELSIMEQSRLLGVIREQYLGAEAQQFRAIGESRQKHQAVLQTMADKYGIDIKKEAWVFDQASATFSKAPKQQQVQ